MRRRGYTEPVQSEAINVGRKDKETSRNTTPQTQPAQIPPGQSRIQPKREVKHEESREKSR